MFYSGFQAVLTEPLPINGHIRHNIVVHLLKIGRAVFKSFHLADDKVQWRQLVDNLMNLKLLQS
jgi:hypothetical protein